MKICLLGSSPIQCLYAFELSKNHEVCVLDKLPFTGGAWQSRPFANISTPIFNNIIYPYSTFEESLLPKISLCLNQYGVFPKSVTSDSYYSIVEFKPKNCLIADFSPLFDKLKQHTSISLIQDEVSSIADCNGRFIVQLKSGNCSVFDKVILPYNFYMNSFMGFDLESSNFTINKSMHFRAIVHSNSSIAKYSEDFDNVFDRGGVNSFYGKQLFIGRVRRAFKHLNSQELIRKSNFLSCLDRHLFGTDLNYFTHCQLNPKLFQIIFNSCKHLFPSLIFLDTRQFVSAYSEFLSNIDVLKESSSV